MLRILLVVICLLIGSGCAKLAHLNELLTLKAVSDEQARNDKIVKAYDAKFFQLIEAQKNNQLVSETKKSILKKFIKPIQIENVQLNGQSVERWIYRQYVKYLHSAQVYLYFDADAKLIKSEYFPATEKKSSETSDAQASNSSQ